MEVGPERFGRVSTTNNWERNSTSIHDLVCVYQKWAVKNNWTCICFNKSKFLILKKSGGKTLQNVMLSKKMSHFLLSLDTPVTCPANLPIFELTIVTETLSTPSEEALQEPNLWFFEWCLYRCETLCFDVLLWPPPPARLGGSCCPLRKWRTSHGGAPPCGVRRNQHASTFNLHEPP